MQRQGKSYSRNQHSFAVSPNVTRPRSTFSRPSRTTTAIDAGLLYPFHVDEVLPGDTFQVKAAMFGRLATPLQAFMDNLYLDTFWFFVPHRLVWDNWEKFQGQQVDPDDSIDFTIPQLVVGGGSTSGANKLADYFGIPTQAISESVSALPFRAYNKIYNDHFRDQNLQVSVREDTGDAASTEGFHLLKKRGKRKDYITGGLPWPQKGDAVLLPIGDSAPVTMTDDAIIGIGDKIPRFTGGGLVDDSLRMTGSSPNVNWEFSATSADDAEWGVTQLGITDSTGTADLSAATGIPLADFRQAIAIQHVLELDARTGTRYVESLLGRWGVTSPDFRLQRAEYLGGGSQNISVIPVPVTSDAEGGLVGDTGAYGVSAGQNGFTHSFTEHGTLIGLVSIRADLMYYQGLHRMWSRLTRYDFAEPELCHLSEQAVLNKEVYVSNDANDDLVFAYQERFSEYKYGNSMCTGIMRPNHPQSLDIWHLAQVFATLPVLDDTFISENPPIDRVIAVPSEPHFKLDAFISNQCTRVMPVFNTPGLDRL